MAAPGDPVWILGVPRDLQGEGGGKLSVGSQGAGYATDPTASSPNAIDPNPRTPSPWLRFTVPDGAGGGPQRVTFGSSNPKLTQWVGKSGLSLTVLPRTSAREDTVLYVTPSAARKFKDTYLRKLEQLLGGCEKTCPAELKMTLETLSKTAIPDLQPLVAPDRKASATASAITPPTAAVQGLAPPPLVRPSSVLPRPGANLANGVPAPALRPQPRNFCGWLAGDFTTSRVPTGQAISLMTLLFGGELGIDPATAGHPSQGPGPAPDRAAPPANVLHKFLGNFTGDGEGVTIHVLDTSDGKSDPFVMPRRAGGTDEAGEANPNGVTYYDTTYLDRPFHGSLVGEVARTVAPRAGLAYQQVCDRAGICKTLAVAKALCTVAEEARQDRGGRHIVNLSAGGSYPALGLQLALRELAAVGVPTVAAFGNRDDCQGLQAGDHCNHYPADWTRNFAAARGRNAPTLLLSVAGWDIATRKMATYNRGSLQGVGVPGLITPPPSVVAPGEFWFGGKPYFGTSFAAPVVTGVLANWMSCKAGVPFLPLVTATGQLPLSQNVLMACP
ncbi:S8 family serine peptidase [Deinococcus arenicola]|uniref:S8 family serine peptidase n=1 Tax=Deinococcus arenicola TaxID=2994950 RepID=A0ABU4DP81_9DEIO|nr:S8 family serine peptidase [Deinococcus sp. ZS9-10]MDV6373700.1 S8 family serine peptidase [Deinococcus sp. ZS9-10]